MSVPSTVSSHAPKTSKCDRYLHDSWTSNPPQVTSVITCTIGMSTPTESSVVTHTSPTCGLGWRFQVLETYSSKPPGPNAQSQEKSLAACVSLSFHPPSMFTILAFSSVTIHVKVTFTTDAPDLTYEKEFTHVSLKDVHDLGSYEPPRYKGKALKTYIATTLMFNPSDGLTLPTTPHVNTQAALRDSLEDPSFIDTKFYLYSAKHRGLPTRPKVVFANSRLLVDSSSYLESREHPFSILSR